MQSSSSSSQMTKSLEFHLEEQRRLKQRQYELRMKNQIFEGGDKEGTKRRKSKKIKNQRENSIGAAEKKSSSSNGNEILPIRSISNYQEMPNIVGSEYKKKSIGGGTTKGTSLHHQT